MASFTAASPAGGQYIDATVVNLTAFTDDTQATEDPTAQIFYQRYVQSAPGVYDVTNRFNLSSMGAGCIHVRFFDPDNFQTTLYTAPDECDIIARPIERTDTALQIAYDRGDFAISINGYDVVHDLGYEIKSLYESDGETPITFTQFLPGRIYVDPQVGMFMFFHYPDKWDSGCSYWDFSWWDNGGLPESVLNDYPYVSLWDDETNGFGPVGNIFSDGINPGEYAPGCGGGSSGYGYGYGYGYGGGGQPWEEQNWDNINNPIPLNTYWNTVSEAPTEEATVLCCYWTQDDTDPLEPRGGGTPDITYAYRSRRYTSPVTIATDTQLRFRSVDGVLDVEDTKTESYEVGLRVDLNKGINLISQPREIADPDERKLNFAFSGLDLLQIYRLENGLWETWVPDSGILNDFEEIDNTHGLFVIMNGPGTFCFPYGENPEATTLSIVDRDTNQGINAIGVPRTDLADNSIDNLLVSRDVEFDEIHRITDGIFETYIPDRAPALNFSPTDLTPGRGYAIVTSKAQTFELPFID